jgi:hypothetical protein
VPNAPIFATLGFGNLAVIEYFSMVLSRFHLSSRWLDLLLIAVSSGLFVVVSRSIMTILRP